MKLNNLKIGTLLVSGFSIVLTLTMIVGIKAIIEMQNLANDIVLMHKHPLAVSNTVRDIKADIIAIHRSMKDVALAKDLRQIETAVAIVEKYEQKVYKSFKLVSQRFLGEQSDVQSAKLAFSEWNAIRNEVIRLMILGEKDKAANITKGKGARHVDEMNQKIQVMIDFASQKANSFFENSQQNSQWAISLMIILLIVTFVMSVIVAIIISVNIVNPLTKIVHIIKNVAKGDLTQKIDFDISRNDAIGELARATSSMLTTLSDIVTQANAISLGDYTINVKAKGDNDLLVKPMNNMVATLRQITTENKQQNWLKTGQTQLNETMRGDMEIVTLARKIITYIAKYLEVQVGTLYLYDDKKQELQLKASYAFNHRKKLNNVFKLGDGLVGQAGLEQEIILITDVPEDYTRIVSGIGETVPRNIIVIPMAYNNRLTGVVELGAFQAFTDNSQQFLETVTENIAISITSAQARAKMTELLAKSQAQAEELVSQQDELSATNEELEERTQALEKNEASLRKQQQKLQVTNDELQKTKQEIEEKAHELEISSRYKSEFLANMSHELRTPLNSILILSQQLAEENNLTEEQKQSANMIYNGGQDLLQLISEILDLAKIEAGKMTIELQTVSLFDIISQIEVNFKPLADKSNIALHINIAADLPPTIKTDSQRLSQILKNLLSNAFKFTKEGSISLDLQRADDQADLSRSGLDPQQAIAIAVIDTGIGIPKDKQLTIFEAFQQADGSISREYGGTGLGLSISKTLSKLLGGELQLSSVENEGSRFTVYLPLAASVEKSVPTKEIPILQPLQKLETQPSPKIDNEGAKCHDNAICFKDKKILIVDDDMRNIYALSGTLQKNGLDVYKARNGQDALKVLNQNPSIDLVLMDIMMPVMDGYETMQAIRALPHLKHLPIIALTAKAMKVDQTNCINAGANDYLTKPIDLNKLLSLMKVWLYNENCP